MNIRYSIKIILFFFFVSSVFAADAANDPMSTGYSDLAPGRYVFKGPNGINMMLSIDQSGSLDVIITTGIAASFMKKGLLASVFIEDGHARRQVNYVGKTKTIDGVTTSDVDSAIVTNEIKGAGNEKEGNREDLRQSIYEKGLINLENALPQP